MPFKQSASNKEYVSRALETSINIGLAALLAASCLLILKPFVPLIASGIIIAVVVVGVAAVSIPRKRSPPNSRRADYHITIPP